MDLSQAVRELNKLVNAKTAKGYKITRQGEGGTANVNPSAVKNIPVKNPSNFVPMQLATVERQTSRPTSTTPNGACPRRWTACAWRSESSAP